MSRLACVVALAVAALLVIFGAAPAAADFTLCEPGSAAGQCKGPEGVAIDPATGNVYVAETGNNRVSVFDPAGEFLFAFGWGVADGTTNALQTCTATCFAGIAGEGPGQFQGALSIAIDSDPASHSYGNLYVAENSNIRVQKFSPSGEFILMLGGGVNKTTGSDICTAESGNVCGVGLEEGGDGEFNSLELKIGVGLGGTLYVADTVPLEGASRGTRIQSFEPSGSFVGELVEVPRQFRAMAVDSSGDFYLGFGAITGSWEKYESDGTPAGTNPTPVVTVTTHNLRALAVGPGDRLFAAETDGPEGRRVITEYDSAGNVLRRFGYGTIAENLAGIAVDTAGGVFASERFQDRVIYLSPPGPGPLACCTTAAPGNTKATLKGGVNPEGKATSYRFEYLSEDDYVENGNSFTAGPNEPVLTPTFPIGEDLSLHEVEAEIGCANPPAPSCLAPATAYRYRLVADNVDGQSVSEGSFETKPPFEILETYATAVSTDSARLNASVNPLGIPATGYFEYVTEAAYQADLEEGGDGFATATQGPEIDFGSGNAPKAASLHLSKLPPGTAYRYRIVVSDSFVAEVPGPERAFTTFALPSPPSNSCSNAAFRTGPSALLPGCRAYEMVSPVDKNGGDIKVLASLLNFPARLDQSADDGESIAYSSVAAFAGAKSAPWTSQYIARRTPGVSWSTEPISPPRLSGSLGELALTLDSQYKAFSPDLSSGWFVQDTDLQLDECAPAGVANLYRREADGGYEALVPNTPTNAPKGQYRLELQGLSADGTHAVFRANAKLTAKASSTKDIYQLYMHVREEGCGELRLLSALPGGATNLLGSSAGSVGSGGEQAVGESRDNTVARAVSADGSRVYWSTRGVVDLLYLRLNADQEQSADGKCSEPEKACTLQITSVGAHFWSASADGSKAIYEIAGAGAAPGELYEYDLAKALAGETASTLIAGQARGMVAASEDASRVYFVSGEAIGGEGDAGEPNLYLYDATKIGAERYRLVATVTDSDLISPLKGMPFALASQNPLQTGVRATADGGRLAFVSSAGLAGYDSKSAAEGKPTLEIYLYDADAGELACVSCNPTGARPVGRLFGSLNVAAQLPAGYNQTTFPRALSSDGDSLFFEAFEALLPRDTNGRADVYQWQSAAGQAACDAIGAELYVPRAMGCISLISTGQSASDSEIADASPDSSNVFIRTASSLLPQDPGQVDIYDARVGGGLPQPPPTPAACEGEACQGPLAPPVEQTPASSTFQGPGNVKPAPKPKPCAKGKVRRKGRCVPKPCAKGKVRRKGRCVPRQDGKGQRGGHARQTHAHR